VARAGPAVERRWSLVGQFGRAQTTWPCTPKHREKCGFLAPAFSLFAVNVLVDQKKGNELRGWMVCAIRGQSVATRQCGTPFDKHSEMDAQ
jgi:hypothetical protein